MNSNKILIFGVFDGIHEGHLHFINQAKAYGDHIIAIVARDSVVEKLKGKTPKNNEVERINALLEIPEIDRVLLGDPDIGAYNVLKEVMPDIVFLGYDQKDLLKDLKAKMKSKYLDNFELKIGEPYKEDEFHSSILNKE